VGWHTPTVAEPGRRALRVTLVIATDRLRAPGPAQGSRWRVALLENPRRARAAKRTPEVGRVHELGSSDPPPVALQIARGTGGSPPRLDEPPIEVLILRQKPRVSVVYARGSAFEHAFGCSLQAKATAGEPSAGLCPSRTSDLKRRDARPARACACGVRWWIPFRARPE